MWSVACVIFELLTAEYLFDPQSQGNLFGKDDDHMAQIIELLGDFDTEMKFGGRYSREIFDSSGKPSGSLYMAISYCDFAVAVSRLLLGRTCADLVIFALQARCGISVVSNRGP